MTKMSEDDTKFTIEVLVSIGKTMISLYAALEYAYVVEFHSRL